MSTLGTLGLFLACILLALSAGGSLWADGTRRRLLTLSRIAFYGAGTVVFWCLILLFSAFLLNDFSIRYVVEHSSLTTPWYYRLSALWAGPEGTLFLWLFLILAGVSAAGFQIRGAQAELHRRVTLISSLISLTLLAMILFFANPFAPKLIPVGDGLGLNPLLRDWAMILHPPILFAGYACLAVTFVFATSRFDDPAAAPLSARWARLACGALTGGIVTGALWAYDELGWGGYWGWDPVENASLVPWLISFALLHFSSRRARVITRSTVMLSGLAFAGTIVATYLTRSGIVFSLHAFADNSSASIFLLALGVVMLFTVIRALRTPRTVHPLPGTMMMMTMGWLIMMTLAVLIGTLWPVWAKVIIDTPRALPASFYNMTVGLLGLGLLVTLGVCSLGSIHRSRRIEVLLIAAAMASVICFGLWFFVGRFDVLKLVGLFVLAGDGVIIIFDTVGRRRQFLHRLPMTIAHVGLVVLSLGLMASMAPPTVKSLVLEREQSDKTRGLHVRLDALRVDEENEGAITVEADLGVSTPYRQETLQPSQTLVEGRRRIEPDYRVGIFSDIYAVLEGFSETQVLVSVRQNWLVGWVWGGSGLILIGCLLAAARRRGGSIR